MAVTNGYCSVADVREHLADSGSKLDTELIERAINAASRSIDQWCGRRFWLDAAVTARVYRPEDPYMAWVADIGSSAGLVVKTDTSADGSWATTWDAADYVLEPLNAAQSGAAYAWSRIAAVGSRSFPCLSRRPALQVTARHGWSAVPDEVNQACILKAVALFRRKDAPFGVAGVGEFGPLRITRKDPDVIGLLDPFVRMTSAGA